MFSPSNMVNISAGVILQYTPSRDIDGAEGLEQRPFLVWFLATSVGRKVHFQPGMGPRLANTVIEIKCLFFILRTINLNFENKQTDKT